MIIMKRNEKFLLSRDKGEHWTAYIVVRIRKGRPMVKFDGRPCMEMPLVVTDSELAKYEAGEEAHAVVFGFQSLIKKKK